MKTYNWEGVNPDGYFLDKLEPIPSALPSFQKLFQVSATALSIPGTIKTMKNINYTRSSISDDIRNILCGSANMRRAIPLILRLLMNYVNLSTNLASHFFDLVIGKILT